MGKKIWFCPPTHPIHLPGVCLAGNMRRALCHLAVRSSTTNTALFSYQRTQLPAGLCRPYSGYITVYSHGTVMTSYTAGQKWVTLTRASFHIYVLIGVKNTVFSLLSQIFWVIRRWSSSVTRFFGIFFSLWNWAHPDEQAKIVLLKDSFLRRYLLNKWLCVG